jgi:hypothetical protein
VTVDANKKQELLNIGYRIPGTCGICVHGQFNQDAFGTCAIHEYRHLKHTGSKRQLSVYVYGRCPKFELDGGKARLGLWQEFMKA